MSKAIDSENRAIRAAHDELRSHLDYLKASDLEDAHRITSDEAYRAIEIMRAIIAKLEPASRKKGEGT